MSDALVIILVSAAAIGSGMAFTAWRIRRLQYPPELQWPDESKRHRKHRHSEKDKDER